MSRAVPEANPLNSHGRLTARQQGMCYDLACSALARLELDIAFAQKQGLRVDNDEYVRRRELAALCETLHDATFGYDPHA